MIIQDAILGWLGDELRDYDEGVYLFTKSSKNASLKRHFSRPSSPSRIAKLIYELRKIADLMPSVVKVHVTPLVVLDETPLLSLDAIVIPKGVAPDIDPAECTSLDEITLLKNQCFQKRNAYRNKLSLYKTDEERYAAVLKVVHYQAIVKDCWHSLDYYKEHGKLPPGKLLGESSKNKLRARASNLRTYISKVNKKISLEEDEVKLIKLRDKLADFETERTQIRLKLEL